MSVIKELIRAEQDGTVSFGDYTLAAKAKLDNFEHNGDLYKVKTYKQITKLERNGMLVYESVPGTAVTNLGVLEDGMQFSVSGPEDAQVTVELESSAEYEVYIESSKVGDMKTNFGGKLSISIELDSEKDKEVKITKIS